MRLFPATFLFKCLTMTSHKWPCSIWLPINGLALWPSQGLRWAWLACSSLDSPPFFNFFFFFLVMSDVTDCYDPLRLVESDLTLTKWCGPQSTCGCIPTGLVDLYMLVPKLLFPYYSRHFSPWSSAFWCGNLGVLRETSALKTEVKVAGSTSAFFMSLLSFSTGATFLGSSFHSC